MAAKKTVKKSTVKKSVSAKKSTPVVMMPESSMSSANFMKSATPQQRKRMYVIFVATAVVILALFAMRGYIVAAMVNGQPITRLKVIGQLEKQGGKQILDYFVRQSLIIQEAEKRGISVTDEDNKKFLAKIDASLKQQGQTLDQALKINGVTKQEVLDQAKADILLEKMVGSDIKVTQKEVDDFIAANNEAYGGTLTAAQVKTDLLAEKQKAKQDELLAKLQKDAKIDYFVSY